VPTSTFQNAGHPDETLRGHRGTAPFYLGYAHEALARAKSGLDRGADAKSHGNAAAPLAAAVKDKHYREALMADLAMIV
jgi:hypothetical protein